MTELRHLAAVQPKKREKREADAARRARIRQLEKLEEHYEQTWGRIDELLKESRAKAHKEAVTLLVDLRDLAEYRGLSGPFQLRFGRILAAAKSRPAVMRRLREAGLAE